MAVFAFGFPGIVRSFPPLLSQPLTGDIHTATGNRKKKKSPTESPPNLKLLFQFQDEVPPVARLFHLCVTVYAHFFNTPWKRHKRQGCSVGPVLSLQENHGSLRFQQNKQASWAIPHIKDERWNSSNLNICTVQSAPEIRQSLGGRPLPLRFRATPGMVLLCFFFFLLLLFCFVCFLSSVKKLLPC